MTAAEHTSFINGGCGLGAAVHEASVYAVIDGIGHVTDADGKQPQVQLDGPTSRVPSSDLPAAASVGKLAVHAGGSAFRSFNTTGSDQPAGGAGTHCLPAKLQLVAPLLPPAPAPLPPLPLDAALPAEPAFPAAWG
jgi:hypothetical protein